MRVLTRSSESVDKEEIRIVLNEGQPGLEAHFTVYQDLIVQKSGHFKKACQEEWDYAGYRTVKLSEIDVPVFKMYLHWVYAGKISIDTSYMNESEKHPFARDAAPLLGELANLWLLADRLEDSKLCNTVMDELLGVLKRTSDPMEVVFDIAFPCKTIDAIWSAPKDAGELINLVLDYYTSKVDADDMDEQFGEYHNKFIFDFLIKSLRIIHGRGENYLTMRLAEMLLPPARR